MFHIYVFDRHTKQYLDSFAYESHGTHLFFYHLYQVAIPRFGRNILLKIDRVHQYFYDYDPDALRHKYFDHRDFPLLSSYDKMRPFKRAKRRA